MKTLVFYCDEKGEWRWKFKSPNGKIIGASSEGFKRLRGAQDNWSLLVGSMDFRTVIRRD